MAAVLAAGGLVAAGLAILPTRERRPETSPIAVDRLPSPSPPVARATVDYLGTEGAVLVRRQEAASTVLRLSSRAAGPACQSAADAMAATGAPADLLLAIVKVPDEVLRGLLIGEQAADTAVLRACGNVNAADFDQVLKEARRLHDAAAARRTVLGAP